LPHLIWSPVLTLLSPIVRTPDAPPPQRSVGHLSVGAGARNRLVDLRQQGSLKALFPRVPVGAPLEAVFLNTSGGLTGGDRMRIAAVAREGARIVLSSQAAERIYRAPPGPEAVVDVALSIGPGARIDWLPQETILFDGGAVARRLTVDMAEDARALIVEPVILGRAAMGEVVREARFRDRWTVTRGGEVVFADALRLEGDIAALMDRPAIAGGARAWASVLFVAPEAETFLVPLRALLGPASGVSLIREGVLFARVLAQDGFEMRRVLIPVVERLAQAALPKVWRL
jgi:urease accessory protein